MKNVPLVFFIAVFFFTGVTSYAQNKTFGIGTSALNPNAALQVDAPSGNQGLQLPRLTTAQRTGMTLTAADKGLMVFDTNLNSIHTWDGAAWTNAQKLALPYKDSTTQALSAGARLLAIKYKGTSDIGVAQFQNYSTAANYPVVAGLQLGVGFAGSFVVNNPANGGTALSGSTNSDKGGALAPVGVYGESTGTGSVGGAFWNTNAANSYPSLYSQTNGTGPGLVINQNGATGDLALFKSNNTTKVSIFKDGAIHNSTDNSWTSFQTANSGDGFAGAFWIDKVTSTNSAVYAETHGTGVSIEGATSTGWAAFRGANSGTGMAGFFAIENPDNTNTALHAETDGTGGAAYFAVSNGSNPGAAVFVKTDGTGSAITGQTASGFAAVYGEHTGTANGHAGLFKNLGANTYPALQVEKTAGTGTAITINHAGSTGDIALFTTGTFTPVARIDKTGKGFFNGGTQNNGADVAELFDVEGGKQNYEPGDVLVISESTDRTVEKSSSVNSTKVAGVYATKPGVTLTERGVEESLDDLVPMGVIGVIPTKVCDENGPIKRGDLLVTSSVSGHAMKAKPVMVNGVAIYPTGAVLGKALENWEAGKGLIKVLVNVK